MDTERKKPEGSLISYFSRKVKKHGGINLAQGRPGYDPPKPLLDILKKSIPQSDLHQYAPGNGDPRLLELLALHYNGICKMGTDNILITKGATEGIFQIFLYLTTQLKKPYSVLSFDPVYESYDRLAKIFKLSFEYSDLDDNLQVDFDSLEKICMERKVKIIFIASPGNPLGKVWEKEEIEKILELSARHSIYVIFDAVYQDIYFSSKPFNPLKLQSPYLFYVNSFSKMLSVTGWRVGYIISHQAHIRKIMAILDYTGLSAPYLLQSAIAGYLETNNFGQEYVRNLRKKIRQSYSYLKNALKQVGFQTPDVTGGYFLWTKLPAAFQDGFSFAWDLYEFERVGTVPGENFSQTKNDFIRLNFAMPLSTIQEASQRIQHFVLGNQ